MIETAPFESKAWPTPGAQSVSPLTLLLLAVAFGLCGGFLDDGLIVLKKLFWNEEGYYRNAADFPWTVPLGHAVLTLALGLFVALASVIRPKRVSLRTAAWLFATLAIWGALLRLPLYGACSLVLAMGLAVPVSKAVSAQIATFGLRSRRVLGSFAAICGLLVVLVGLTTGLQMVRESRAVAALPSPSSSSARNVILIVWDTVCAYNVSLNGYRRDTTPHLRQWAKQGVAYTQALAPAPWTYPSHCSFLTGQWPSQLNTQWKLTLDTPKSTLAEYLASRGYQTAGFVANTNCCSYESGLGRGFAHYDDYLLTSWSPLTRTVPGHWLATRVLYLGDYYFKKWLDLQSRGASSINRAFLRWLNRRRPDRPFFAFLNYFDVHEPYVPPLEYVGRFGIAPVTPGEFLFLHDYVGLPKDLLVSRYRDMALGCYDSCIAFVDAQVDGLLNDLQSRGLLDQTDVIIVSDHGEGFGAHGVSGHGYSVNLDEVGVPLLILSPTAPAGKVVENAVSLRDLPATVVDLLGLSADSPFPGRSLAAYWNEKPGQPLGEITSPAFTERVDSAAFKSHSQEPTDQPWFEMSLVALGHQYIRDGSGHERLYNLMVDRYATRDLMNSAAGKERVGLYRRMLLEVLTENPGSAEVEEAYLDSYRKKLREDVERGVPRQVASGR
ncbi:MAG: sulfatase-like hydrolase/transferase [Isosphaeraceae bacterium]